VTGCHLCRFRAPLHPFMHTGVKIVFLFLLLKLHFKEQLTEEYIGENEIFSFILFL
jgi:hypothetical protein